MSGAINVTFAPDYQPGDVNSFPLVQYDSLISRFREVNTLNLPGGLLADPTYYANYFNLGENASRFIASSGGAWNDAGNWLSRLLPEPESDVLIDLPGSYSVTINSPVNVASLDLGSDAGGSQTLLVTSEFTVTGGDIHVASGGDIVLTNATITADVESSGRRFARGTSKINGAYSIAVAGAMFVQGVSGLGASVLTVAAGISSIDAFLGLPIDILGTDYVVLGYKNLDVTADVFDTFPGTQLVIAASLDNTTITITPSVTTGARTAGYT